ncbi:hypothetical protein JTE90_025490 [Oedothorax gibbosus]|uniref:Uncharacterized protein n=1 Tax=Oedothorax gibbosus TaxID=931172 RepID=A0AAV6UZF1_9ARAC|nr:hypothetical protein JTE90_025490 [Oedothorax gibbosus]
MDRKDKQKRKQKSKPGHTKQDRKKSSPADKHKSSPSQQSGVQEVFSIQSSSPGDKESPRSLQKCRERNLTTF